MNIYLDMLRAAGKLPVFEKPNEGNPGGGDDDAAKAAAAAAAAADAAVKKAQEDADAAKKAADANEGNSDLQKLAKEKADLLSEVMDKKTKLKAAQEEAANAKKALEAYEGVDPTKVKELLRKEAEAEKAAAEAKGDFDRVKQMMADEHAKETKTLKEQIEDLKNQLGSKNSVIDELTIGNAFGNSTFIKESLVLSSEKTRTIYGAHFEMKDGKLVAYDKPASAANRTLLVNSAGDPLPFEEALERIVSADPDKKTVLKSKAKPGGGSSTITTPNSQNKNDAKNEDGLYGRSRLAASLKDEFK